nr:hypothetical protein [Clostridium sp. OF09-10]
MKKQECSQLFVAIVPFLCAFLFAFWLWRYLRQPEPDTDRLTVAITYTNYNFNTITPLPEMECAIDKNFSKRSARCQAALIWTAEQKNTHIRSIQFPKLFT